jgi:hypothetical protein
MLMAPMFVHCCHCIWCQRETGTAFALNALIEGDRVVLLQGEVDVVNTPTNSGKGQNISRCTPIPAPHLSHTRTNSSRLHGAREHVFLLLPSCSRQRMPA